MCFIIYTTTTPSVLRSSNQIRKRNLRMVGRDPENSCSTYRTCLQRPNDVVIGKSSCSEEKWPQMWFEQQVIMTYSNLKVFGWWLKMVWTLQNWVSACQLCSSEILYEARLTSAALTHTSSWVLSTGLRVCRRLTHLNQGSHTSFSYTVSVWMMCLCIVCVDLTPFSMMINDQYC